MWSDDLAEEMRPTFRLLGSLVCDEEDNKEDLLGWNNSILDEKKFDARFSRD